MKLLTILFLLLCSCRATGQIKSEYFTGALGKIVTITDTITGDYFVLDSVHTTISAFNSKYQQIWVTNPYKDNKIMEYHQTKPEIVAFGFSKNEYSNYLEVIAISYSNSQFGFIDKKSGRYTFLGQD